jgi:hypothetical protein
VVGVRREVRAELGVGETELLGGVAVLAVGTGAVPLAPVGDRPRHVGRELEAEEVVDARHRPHRIGDQPPVVDVEEAVLAEALPGGHRLLDTLAQVLAERPAEPVQVTLALRLREQRRADAHPRRDGLHRVAMGHHEPGLGIGGDDRLEVEVVVRRLEQPLVGRAP